MKNKFLYETFARPFRQPEFAFLLFSLCVVLFCWPFLAFPDNATDPDSYAYFFLSWLAVIFILFLFVNVLKREFDSEPGKQNDPGAPDV